MRVKDRPKTCPAPHFRRHLLSSLCEGGPLIVGQPILVTDSPGPLRPVRHAAVVVGEDEECVRPARLGKQPCGADGPRDAFVAARAADRAAALGAFDDARGWLRPFWDQPDDIGADERASVALALVSALPGLGPEWLPRLEAASTAYAREGAVALAVGCALAERQLWGKARRLLGYEPTYDVGSGLREALPWYEARLGRRSAPGRSEVMQRVDDVT